MKKTLLALAMLCLGAFVMGTSASAASINNNNLAALGQTADKSTVRKVRCWRCRRRYYYRRYYYRPRYRRYYYRRYYRPYRYRRWRRRCYWRRGYRRCYYRRYYYRRYY
jgi:hypothetical protein